MDATSQEKPEVRKQFIFFANELNNTFPDLDLRFNLKSGSKTVRYRAAAVSEDCFETELSDETQELIYEAILNIKEIAQIYDA